MYSLPTICWGAQASLYYFYQIPEYTLPKELSGVFKRRVLTPMHPLICGFDGAYFVPHSHNTEVRREDVKKYDELVVLSDSDETGAHIIANKSGRQFFVMGHTEYGRETLSDRYYRDLDKGIDPDLPEYYFPDDDPTQTPALTWRSGAGLLLQNRLNYYVYRQTPCDLGDLSE